MKIDFNNLYTHFVFITHLRQAVIPEKNRIEIEKYITGIVKNNSSYDHFLPSTRDQANYKIDKIGLWGSLPGY